MTVARQDITHRLYCDEAGNTGANYFDATQPMMVFASWLIALDSEDKVLAAINDLEKNSKAPEIHGKRILRNPAGWVRASALVDAVIGTGGTAFFFVLEKRYQLAERMVHALLDRVTNPRAEGFPSIGHPGYLELLEYLYYLPRSAASAYAKAIAHPTAASVSAAVTAIGTALRHAGQFALAYAIEGCLENLEEVIRYDFSDRGGHKHSQVTSPHVPGFLRMLEAADAYAETLDRVLVEVVHDEIDQYGSVLGEYVNLLIGVGRKGKIRDVPERFPHIGFARIDRFRMAKSHACRFIQVADILATSLARLFRDTLRGSQWTVAGHHIAESILTPLLTDDLTYGGISISLPLCSATRERILAR